MPRAQENDHADCQAEGIIGTVAGTIGILMANEAIKEILSFPNSLCGKILILDLEKTTFRLVDLKNNCTNHK